MKLSEFRRRIRTDLSGNYQTATTDPVSATRLLVDYEIPVAEAHGQGVAPDVVAERLAKHAGWTYTGDLDAVEGQSMGSKKPDEGRVTKSEDGVVPRVAGRLYLTTPQLDILVKAGERVLGLSLVKGQDRETLQRALKLLSTELSSRRKD